MSSSSTSTSRRNSSSRAKYRTRRDSGTKLDYYHKIVQKTILQYQVKISIICQLFIKFKRIYRVQLQAYFLKIQTILGYAIMSIQY